MTNQQLGVLIIVTGLAIALIGVVVWAGGLAWFGKLPGDIRIEGESARVFIPIASMIVISLVLTVALNLLLRLFRR